MSEKKKMLKVGLIVGAVILIGGIGGGSWYLSEQKKQAELEGTINEARQLVLYNPLATGEKSQALVKLLPKPGEKLEMKYLRERVKNEPLDKMISEAGKEIESLEKEQLTAQEKIFVDTQKKIDELKKNSHFPEEQLVKIKELTSLTDQYLKQSDVVGMNIGVAGLQSIAGETTTFIQEKTEEQRVREEEEKKKEEEKTKAAAAEAEVLTTAIEDETFPSFGMLRGDIANGGGVIPMYLLTDGPAYDADFNTHDFWDNSSVIVEIDGHKVESAVIGEHSMEKVLKKIKLGKRVEVKFKDGSTKDIDLNLTHKKAKAYKYPDLPDPGKDSSTDVYFGVSGYNIGESNDNKEIGLVITDLYPDGSAYSSDLVKGDIICRIDGYYVGDSSDVNRIMSNYYEGTYVTVDYIDANGDLQSTDVYLIESGN